MESTLVRCGIPAIALVLAALFVLAVFVAEGRAGVAPALRRRHTAFAALGMAGWLVFVAALALSGALARFDVKPPPMMLWFAATFLLPFGVAVSPFGRRLAVALPFGALVGFQAFRLPLELVMHRAATDGLMPNVMTYTGYNFDILSGVTALLLGIGFLLGNVPRILVVVWNALGSLLLAVIVGVAIAATPIFKAFGDAQVNVWVTRFPYAWMSVMVGSALFGHLLVWKKLAATRSSGVLARQSTAGT
jgi:hypothetical protein